MPIGKGSAWGEPGGVPDGAPRAADDADLAARVHDTLLNENTGSEPWIGTVASGDLLRTVGGTSEMRPDTQRLPVDLGLVKLDDGDWQPFVAHVVARRRFWVGQCAVVMNAAWLGEWYLGPRSHPNDGLLDVTIGALQWRERLEARRRAPSGSHLPHPALSTKRVAEWEHTFARPTPVLIDGVQRGRAKSLVTRVFSDAFIVVV